MTILTQGVAVRMVWLLVFAVLALIHAWPRERLPPRMQECEPWMADCLPGVGLKTRDEMAASIRVGNLQKLPAKARVAAGLLFSD